MSTAFPAPSHRGWTEASDQTFRTPQSQPLEGWLLFTVFSLSAIAFGISVYLAWTGLTMSSVAGCGGGGVFDCEHVLTSKWSKWMGVPVGVGASILYSAALAAAGVLLWKPAAPVRRAASATLVSLGMTAGLCAVWFISLQVFVLQHLCPWCLAAHSCGLLLALIMIWFRPQGLALPKIPTMLAVAGTSILVIGQVKADAPVTYEIQKFDTLTDEQSPAALKPGSEATEIFAAPVFEPPIFEPPTEPSNSDIGTTPESGAGEVDTRSADEPLQAGLPPFMIFALLLCLTGWGPGLMQIQAADESKPSSAAVESREVTFGRGTKLRLKDWPLLGSSDARHVFVEMFDYTCPHCRESHRNVVRDLKKKYGRELAIVALPVPLNSKCNPSVRTNSAEHIDACELSELSVAVWKTDPARFEEFHDWLMAGTQSRSATEARKYAEELVDKDRLHQLTSSSFCKAYVKKHVELYQTVGSGAIPKFLFADTALVGRVDSAQAIADILERQQ